MLIGAPREATSLVDGVDRPMQARLGCCSLALGLVSIADPCFHPVTGCADLQAGGQGARRLLRCSWTGAAPSARGARGSGQARASRGGAREPALGGASVQQALVAELRCLSGRGYLDLKPPSSARCYNVMWPVHARLAVTCASALVLRAIHQASLVAHSDSALTQQESAGTEVWCEEDKYPRLLTEVIHGIQEQRCACFARVGWNDMRQVYRGCKPDAHRCSINEEQARVS